MRNFSQLLDPILNGFLDRLPLHFQEQVGHGLTFRVVEVREPIENWADILDFEFTPVQPEQILQGMMFHSQEIDIAEILSLTTLGDSRQFHGGEVIQARQRDPQFFQFRQWL